MDRLFSEVTLRPQHPSELFDILAILEGNVSIAEVAEKRGQQERYSFDGDGDVLILAYSTEDGPLLSQDDAAKELGRSNINMIFMKKIIPALAKSLVGLEFVVTHCNLSTATIIAISDAIRYNKSIVGFRVQNNPGNDDIGTIALRNACIQTAAPIMWFQGELLSAELEASREAISGSPKTAIKKSRCSSDDTVESSASEDTATTATTPPIPVMHSKRCSSPTGSRMWPNRRATEPNVLVGRRVSIDSPTSNNTGSIFISMPTILEWR